MDFTKLIGALKGLPWFTSLYLFFILIFLYFGGIYISNFIFLLAFLGSTILGGFSAWIFKGVGTALSSLFILLILMFYLPRQKRKRAILLKLLSLIYGEENLEIAVKELMELEEQEPEEESTEEQETEEEQELQEEPAEEQELQEESTEDPQTEEQEPEEESTEERETEEEQELQEEPAEEQELQEESTEEPQTEEELDDEDLLVGFPDVIPEKVPIEIPEKEILFK